MKLLFICAVLLGVIGSCNGSGSKSKPTGTSADPVEVCERVADVCRFDKAKLGVCVSSPAAETGFSCMSQH